MTLKKTDIYTKVHLIISITIVIPASLVYGFFPELILDVQIQALDEKNLLKAVMGLYLGFSFIWFLALFKPKFFSIGIWSNTIFMLGLGVGRIISILVDGLPSALFIFGTVGEFLLGFYGLGVLLRYEQNE